MNLPNPLKKALIAIISAILTMVTTFITECGTNKSLTEITGIVKGVTE